VPATLLAAAPRVIYDRLCARGCAVPFSPAPSSTFSAPLLVKLTTERRGGGSHPLSCLAHLTASHSISIQPVLGQNHSHLLIISILYRHIYHTFAHFHHSLLPSSLCGPTSTLGLTWETCYKQWRRKSQAGGSRRLQRQPSSPTYLPIS